MISWLKHWIVRRISFGKFSRRQDVLFFAIYRTVWTTLAAVFLNFVVHHFLVRFELMDSSTLLDPILDGTITAFVAGPICFFVYFLIGAAILDLAVSRDEFERLSRTDPLTGLLNRRAFLEVIAAMDEAYVLALFDIDRFKTINDTYGHTAGDQVLVGISDLMRKTFEHDHPVARLGGEEFGVVLRGVNKNEAMKLVNRFREALALHNFSAHGKEISVTISAGVSDGNKNFPYSMLLTNADKALYLAKASGRNRVVHADELSVILPSGKKIAL